jgi:hypothetical protein
MARLLTMSNQVLPLNLTLVAGSSYPLKISGLGTDKRHVVLVSSTPLIKVVVVNANDRNVEQTLRLEPAASVPAVTSATLSAYLATKPTQKDGMTQAVMLSIEPRKELPAESSEAGVLARLLLAESISPGSQGFAAKDSLQAMQWMRHAVLNRLKFGAQYFGAAKNATTMTEAIKGVNQFAGFEDYPRIGEDQASVINDVLGVANTSGHKNVLLYRQFVQDAIDVASGTKPGTDPCPTGLYGWRTKRRGSPGRNFELYKGFAGQEFYTLSESFRKDPLQRTKPK